MKRPKLEDTRTPERHQSIGGNSVNVYQYSKLQDEYIDYLEEIVKNCSIPDVVERSEQLCDKCEREKQLQILSKQAQDLNMGYD